MHTRIYFILLMMVSISSHARCDGGLHVWPTGDIINTNPILLIENQPFHDGHDLLFNEIGSKHNFYLKSDNALIKLIVVSKYFGSFGFQQVILRPETKLIPNKKYELVLDSLPLKTHKGRKVENATWTTNNKSDNTIPKFKSKPSV